MVHWYMLHLAPRNKVRMNDTINYIGQNGIPGNSQKAPNVLRKRYLSSFPAPSFQSVKVPKLIVMGFTSEIANVVPLRGLLVRPNILSKMPPVCVGFRESIVETIPCFTYGETLDFFFLNASAVAPDINQNFQCIRGNSRGSKYAVCIKDGFLCVPITDAEYLKQKDAEAILKLQAGFRLEYAEKHTAPFYVQLVTAIEGHVAEICSNLAISDVDTSDWRNTLFEETRIK